MEVQSDYRELLELLNENDVEYLIVEAYALAYHGAPRFTGDLDILVKSDPVNAQRILTALDEFGFGSLGLVAEDFLEPDKVIQLGVLPVRFGIVTSITGVEWGEAYREREEGKYDNVIVNYIGRKQFIQNKRALGRRKDLSDLEALGEE